MSSLSLLREGKPLGLGSWRARLSVSPAPSWPAGARAAAAPGSESADSASQSLGPGPATATLRRAGTQAALDCSGIDGPGTGRSLAQLPESESQPHDDSSSEALKNWQW